MLPCWKAFLLKRPVYCLCFHLFGTKQSKKKRLLKPPFSSAVTFTKAIVGESWSLLFPVSLGYHFPFKSACAPTLSWGVNRQIKQSCSEYRHICNTDDASCYLYHYRAVPVFTLQMRRKRELFLSNTIRTERKESVQEHEVKLKHNLIWLVVK